MRRTLNSTGRKRITVDMFSIEPKISLGKKSLVFSWNLAPLELNQDSEVVIEVSTMGQSERLSVGKLGSGIGIQEVRTAIFSEAKAAKAKILVSALNSSGIRMILATSTGISCLFEKEDDGGGSPLPIQLRDDLTNIWQLDFSSGRPVLLIANSDGIYSELKANPLFFPTILPQVIKEIAFHLLINPSAFEDNPEIWHMFFESLGLSESERERLQASVETDEISLERWAIAESLATEFVLRKNILNEIKRILEGEQ
jgi:hypothetical protein